MGTNLNDYNMGPGGNLEDDESGRRQRSNPGGVRGTSPQDGELRARLCGSRLRVPFGGVGILLCHEPVVPTGAFEIECVFREAIVDVLPPHERATHGDERRQRTERQGQENAVGERRRIR